MTPKLVWNAIVRNEAAILPRCVDSLLPHIAGAILVDTGSTDGTSGRLMELFTAAGKPIEITPAPFVNFEQARNEALRCARLSRMEWDYLLLADADMELRVEREPWFDGGGGLAYDMRQTSGGMGYWNRRLVSRKADGWFVGVTHEYLDIPSAGKLEDAEFIDHADGANRSGKIVRDIALLEEALDLELRPGLIERYHFYLAGAYYDLGDWEKAAEHYKIRVGLSGFDEEQWYAQMRYALCLENLGDKPSFVWKMLAAFRMRPQRAETLYELARYFRESGDNHTGLLFAEAGLQLPIPKSDLLFVNDWVYSHGLREEFAICAYYSGRHRRQGEQEANKLALAGSAQADGNLYWYLRPLVDEVSSFVPTIIAFAPPAGHVATNPSVTDRDGKPLILVRCVNYTITPEGQYAIQGDHGVCAPDNPIHTRNYLIGYCSPLDLHELKLPSEWPSPEFDLVRGFEDSRLFEWDNTLWTLSTVRELNKEGWCEQVMTRLVDAGVGGWRYGNNWIKITPAERRHEKNWQPWVRDGELQFVYRLGTLVDIAGKVVFHQDPGFDVSHISGGSQVIQLDERTWIALVHEARTIPGCPHKRYYRHRFVSFRGNGKVDRISPPFYFHDKQIEFAAGLAYFPDAKQLMVSYGVRDAEAWTATMDPDQVLEFIYKDTL